jgi:hypothetical protein|nr:MAG TPA: baseplate protein [Caudoviricetes sp.]
MTIEDIRQKLGDLAGSSGPAVSNIAKVKSVDENGAVCVLEDEDGQEIPEVRLRPVLTGKKSFLQIPKIGSLVLAVRIEDDEDWMIIACDEVDKFLWVTDTTKIELTDKVHISANNKNMAELIDKLFEAILKMRFTTNAGPTIRLINRPEFESLKNEFKELLK